MSNTVLFELWIISLSLPDGVSCSCCKSDTRCLSTLFVCLFQVSVYGWIWPFMQDNVFNHYVIFRWLGWNINWLVNWEPWPPAQLALHHNRTVQHLQCCWRWTDLCESVLFSLRTMVSDLQEPIFIPAPPHAAANCPSESQRALISEAKRTTSTRKGRGGILSPPNLKFCLLGIPVSLFQSC